jgi:hypothetical protein
MQLVTSLGLPTNPKQTDDVQRTSPLGPFGAKTIGARA